MLPELIQCYMSDERAGVQAVIASANKRMKALEQEKKRCFELLKYEREYSAYSYICGIDEVGRGPLAGPVVAGAVILPKDCDILYINDSKKLSEKKREELYDIIMEKAIACGIGYASPERIDEINILQATYEAMLESAHESNCEIWIAYQGGVQNPIAMWITTTDSRGKRDTSHVGTSVDDIGINICIK